MLSDSSLNYLNRHPIENILDEDELLEWESDLNTITPETAIRMCNLEKMKGTDDLFLPCTFDETYIYEQEAIETQLLTLQHELELQNNISASLNNNSIIRNISNLNNELSINIDSPPLSSMSFKLLIEICLHKLIIRQYPLNRSKWTI